jgi:hypothetical protein
MLALYVEKIRTHTLIPENPNQNKVLQSRRENEKASERKLNM